MQSLIPNYKIPLPVLICLFLFSGIIYGQQNKTADSEEKKPLINQPLAVVGSDGCTMWFDGDYKNCCFQHDADYLTGGDNWRTRLRADNRLFMCVAGKKGIWHLALAPVMWTGVRIFGSDLIPSSRKSVVHKFFKRTFVLIKKRV